MIWFAKPEQGLEYQILIPEYPTPEKFISEQEYKIKMIFLNLSIHWSSDNSI